MKTITVHWFDKHFYVRIQLKPVKLLGIGSHFPMGLSLILLSVLCQARALFLFINPCKVLGVMIIYQSEVCHIVGLNFRLEQHHVPFWSSLGCHLWYIDIFFRCIKTKCLLLGKFMKLDGIVVTKIRGSGMHCKDVIHLDMRETSRKLKEKITQALVKTDEIFRSSVAFPALGIRHWDVLKHHLLMLYNTVKTVFYRIPFGLKNCFGSGRSVF